MNRKASFFSVLFLCFFTASTAQIILLEGRVINPDEVENIHVFMVGSPSMTSQPASVSVVTSTAC